MAIKISGNTVIDDSQNITNITNVTASGTINGGIIATTAEAQAATADDVIMTPAKVKDLLQGGNASVIKSITRFTVKAGLYTPLTYSWGAATIDRSTDASVTINSPDGISAFFSFAILPTPVNPNKTFLTTSYQNPGVAYVDIGGQLVSQTTNPMVRLYGYFLGVGRFPTTSETSWTQIQISNLGYIYPQSSGIPEVSVEVVEFY